jgi:hypothetical protein
MRNILRFAYASALGFGIVLSVCIVPAIASFNSASNSAQTAQSFGQLSSGVTIIRVTSESTERQGKRFGINLGDQTFYGSGQMLKNLVYRNPGFEGEEYRTIIRCENARGHSCDDADTGANWPQDFWTGADYRFLSGKNEGRTGRLSSFTAHPASYGFASDSYPNTGEYFLLIKSFPGDPIAGWWPSAEGGATFAPEFHDLSPHSQGKQALRIEALKPGSAARLTSYFDSYADGNPHELPARSFLRMHGRYLLRFRAKTAAGAPAVVVQVDRGGSRPFLQKRVTLTTAWQDYTIPFDAADDATNTHALELQFGVTGSALLLDDVSLTSAADEVGNPTVFRLPVVEALRQFHPGVLRLMASRTQLGSSIANLLAPPDARVRSGFSPWNTRQEDIPIGIPEFLQLCASLDAEPWITLPTGTSPSDAALLMRFLTSPPTSDVQAGARAGIPWINQFRQIHLELGNETWNTAFTGETMEDAAGYGQHTDAVFRSLRAAPGFQAARFDLVIGGQADWPERNQAILAAAGSSYDSLAVAPYIWRSLSDEPDDDALFGPGMAEPELLDDYGQVRQIADYARNAHHPAHLDIYEVNLHTTGGTASQQTLDRTTPSLAAGLAVAAHMLQMRRDDGAATQMLFNLPEFTNQRSDGKTIRLWGSVVDMGPTQRKRPDFEALALVNQVAQGRMLRTLQDGANPEWNAKLPAAGISTGNSKPVHAIQSFAFDLQESHERALLVFNLGPKPQTIQIQGLPTTANTVNITSLTGAGPSANSENNSQIVARTWQAAAASGNKLQLQPYNLLCVRWHLN